MAKGVNCANVARAVVEAIRKRAVLRRGVVLRVVLQVRDRKSRMWGRNMVVDGLFERMVRGRGGMDEGEGF